MYINQSGNRTRPVQLLIHVTPEEKLQIQHNMVNAGTTNFSAYARKMLLDGYIDFSELKTLIKHLGYIGNNINQIAKVANSTNKLTAKQVKDLQHQWQQLKGKLSESIIKIIRRTNENKL